MVVRGQYEAGEIEDKSVCAYHDEPSVRRDSTTETFVALKVLIDNSRWSGVPIYLRTGKRLSKRFTDIVIQFKNNKPTDFGDMPSKDLGPNTLVLKIQPEEGIRLQFGAKVPGEILSLKMLALDCEYSDYFGKQTTNGYETLLYDCLIGDGLLFARADNVETNWSIVDPILKYGQGDAADTLHIYRSGTMGPVAAEQLLERDGRKWRLNLDSD
jgi:glucose-6-phosphate 1-dehydrogenase